MIGSTFTVLTVKDVHAALDEIDHNGVPRHRRARTYCLAERNRHYPPKYVVGLAWKHATGKERPPGRFNGGKAGANLTLQDLGFTVVKCGAASTHF